MDIQNSRGGKGGYLLGAYYKIKGANDFILKFRPLLLPTVHTW